MKKIILSVLFAMSCSVARAGVVSEINARNQQVNEAAFAMIKSALLNATPVSLAELSEQKDINNYSAAILYPSGSSIFPISIRRGSFTISMAGNQYKLVLYDAYSDYAGQFAEATDDMELESPRSWMLGATSITGQTSVKFESEIKGIKKIQLQGQSYTVLELEHEMFDCCTWTYKNKVEAYALLQSL